MVKIAFHENCLCERGTTVSLYDYAYYNKLHLFLKYYLSMQLNAR